MKSQKRTKSSDHSKNFLVVFYSLSGMTRRVAREIADTLACDIEEIVDLTDRSGPFIQFTGGRDAAMKRPTKIKEVIRNPEKYHVVVIGTPVWAATMTPAIRAFVNKHKNQLKKVAFFCTSDGIGNQNTFEEMRKLCGKTPLATLHVHRTEVKKCGYGLKVRKFVHEIKDSLSRG